MSAERYNNCEAFQALANKDGTVAAINNSKRFAMAICLETDDLRLKGE
jgi:hypothetical protein